MERSEDLRTKCNTLDEKKDMSGTAEKNLNKANSLVHGNVPVLSFLVLTNVPC